MPKIISSSALHNGYNEASAWCRGKARARFFTKNGAGTLAVMDIESHEQLMALLDPSAVPSG